MKLTFDRVTAGYRRKTVVEDVSFVAESGAITAVIGRNGAGKSTLLGCLTGEKQEYAGSVLLDGQDVRKLSRGERSRLVACLPQNLPRPHVTVRELVGFGRAPYLPLTGALSAEDREKVAWAMVAVGMDGFADAFVDELSGGERKKAFFAMTLAQDTPVVALDEPTAHLDVVSRFDFLALLEKLRRETGKTFLVVMHELPEVLRCADKIVVIHEKKVAYCGDAAGCLAAEIPRKCFRVHVSGDRETGYAVKPL